MAKKLEEAREHALSLVEDFVEQKNQMTECDKMFFMEWDDNLKSEKTYKKTISPSARNALQGAIRLMTSTEPKFSVPFDKNDKAAKLQSEKIERFCKTVWYHSGRFRGIPLEQPAIESLLRYGMMVLTVVDTRVLQTEILKNEKSKALEKQLERLVQSTPYLIEAWDPKGVYYEKGRFGLTTVYRETQMTVQEVIEQFGTAPVEKVLGENIDRTHTYVTYCDYWDLEKHMAWINSYVLQGQPTVAGQPLMDEKHELPCIPIVVQTSEGSYLDVEPEKQAIPFLFTLQKGELWKRQNLELTYLYTNLFYLAANPTFKHITTGDGNFDVDYDTPGFRLLLRPGEDYAQLQKDVISSDMLEGLSIADGLVEESTLYRQALGGMGRLGANAAFSTVSLMHQAGRLPLASSQKRGGWAIGHACELMIEMLLDKYKSTSYKTEEGFEQLDIQEIPDDLIIEGRLEVDLPQDQLSQANIAQLVIQSGLASQRWTRENILGIEQSDEMEGEIWTEQAQKDQFTRRIQKLAQLEEMQMQMMMQQMMQQQQGGPPQGGPPQGPPPQGGPPGMGPEGGPVNMPGNAMNAQAGMIPAQRPGEKPTPVTPTGERPMQEGEMPQ